MARVARRPAEDQRLAEQLMHDPKERAEHAIVVAAVREGAGPRSARGSSQPRSLAPNGWPTCSTC